MKPKPSKKWNGYAATSITVLALTCLALAYMTMSLMRTQKEFKTEIVNAKARMEIQKSIMLLEKMRDLEQLKLATSQTVRSEAIDIDALGPLKQLLEQNLSRAAKYYADMSETTQAQLVSKIMHKLAVQQMQVKAEGAGSNGVYDETIKILRELETMEDNSVARLAIHHQDPALLLMKNARLLAQLTDEVSDIGEIARRVQERPKWATTATKQLFVDLKRLRILHNEFAEHFARLRSELALKNIPQISDFGLSKQIDGLERAISLGLEGSRGLMRAKDYSDFSIKANASAKRVYEQIIERLIVLDSQKMAKIVSNKKLIWMILLIFGIAILLTSIAYIKRNALTMRRLKSLNKSLARSENNIRNIIELLPHIVVLQDLSGKILMANKAFRDFRGVVEKANKDKADCGCELIQKILRAENIKLRKGELLATGLESCVVGEGQNKVLQLTSVAYPVDDENTAILTVMIDVTEVYKVKELQKVSGVGYWEWDLDRNQFNFSDKFYEATGIVPAMGRDNFKAYIDSLVADDRERVILAFSDSLETYKPVDIEHRILGDGTKERVVKIKGEVYRSSLDGGMRMAGYVQDITAQKQAEQALKESEQKYRKLVENLSERYFFYSYNIVGVFSYISPTAPAMFGFDNDRLFTNNILKKIAEYVTQTRADAEVMQAGKYQLHREIVVKNGDASTCTLELSEVPVYSEKGKLIGFDGIAHDVTVKKLRESRLKDSEHRLRELAAHLQDVRENERASIAHDIHDEIGGYLMALKMDISLMDKRLDKKDLPVHARFESMKQLLDVAIESTRKMITTLRPSILDELGLLAALEWQLKEFGLRYGVRTLFNHDEMTANTAFMHQEYSVHIFRIFQEILNNVAKHAGAENVSTRAAVNGNVFVLSVTDDGIGFAQEAAKKQGSYGILGMQERIYKMKGTMEILSEEGVGTTVELQIPFYAKAEQTAKSDIDVSVHIGHSG